MITAAQAYVKMLNAKGGLNGHPLQVISCDASVSPNQELGCFQKAVDDHVLALVGSYVNFGTGLPLIQKAGIPDIGDEAFSTQSEQNPDSFPADSGGIGWFFGQAALLKKAGSTRPVIWNCGSPSCNSDVPTFEAGWQMGGGSAKLTQIQAPLSAASYVTEAAQTVADHADGVEFTGSPVDLPKVVTALRQQGYTGPISLIDAYLPQAIIQALGSNTEGLLVSGRVLPSSDTTNPGVATFNNAMNSVDPNAEKDFTSADTWNGYDLLTAVASRVSGNLTPASLLQALQGVSPSNPINLPLSGTWISPNNGALILKDIPRIVDANFVPETVQNGQLVATGPVENAVQTLKS